MGTKRNEIDVDDYYSFSVKERTLLDEWLKKLGGNPTRTRKITIDWDGKMVTAEEWLLDSDGNMEYDIKAKDVRVIEKYLHYEEEPPLWKS